MKTNKLFVVLGMHRSGTSAITRALELFDIKLGNNLHPAGFDNPKGFWEDRECLQINEDLLGHLGSAYDRLDLAWESFQEDSVVSALKIQATQLISRKLAENNGMWGFKDPRTCRLLPFWQEIFSACGCSTSYIIALRNPLSVASSLQRRNHIPFEKSYFLWLQHMLPAVRKTRGAHRLIVDFDLLLDNPAHELLRISSHLGLPQLDTSSPAVKAYIEEFLDHGLNHSQFSLEDLTRDCRLPADVRTTYQLLRSASQDSVEIDDQQFWDHTEELCKRLEDFSPAFAYANALEEERAGLYKTVGNYDLQLAALNQQVADFNKKVASLYEAVGIRDDQISSMQRGLLDRDSALADTYKAVSERDTLIAGLRTQVTEWDEHIHQLRQSNLSGQQEIVQLQEILNERERVSQELNRVIAEQKAQIAKLAIQLTEHVATIEGLQSVHATQVKDFHAQANELDEQVQQLRQSNLSSQKKILQLQEIINEREGASQELNRVIAEKNSGIDSLTAKLAESASAIQELQRANASHEEAAQELASTLTERDSLIDHLRSIEIQRDAEIAQLQLSIVQFEKNLNLVYASKSWQLTRPLRAIRRLPNQTKWFVRQHLSNTARAIWRFSPIHPKIKRQVKEQLFQKLPWIFSKTVAYRDWLAFQKYNSAELNPNPSRSTAHTAPSCVASSSSLEGAIKLIAFYLPQYHPIPENDEWWGKGFTEWTNVTRAKPQFVGHYQPHLPADLGFYDLRVPDVQRQQVELAKQYGLGGFCFYFYWFGGKRLLETPIKQYLENTALDLPFCLCWANENWSRRWNGLDQDILVGQSHSPEDDIAFIEYIAAYLRDPRYIRIDGKPLLLVYRPSLIPSPSETAERWRQWCKEAGIGEIYLAYTQSFEVTNPAVYGFDAAIEFPPNNSAPPVITETVEQLNENFTGIVYDWKIFVERSRFYSSPDYTLFRSVCPSWDNTARRPNGGAVFHNSSPELYEEWLSNACRDTVERFTNPSNRLVFVNAWNEWAEGAHLEPDQKYGHAWLQATSKALQSTRQDSHQNRIIVVTHDAYPHGAQLLALAIARHLVSQMRFAVEIVCLGDGQLKHAFAEIGHLHDLSNQDPAGRHAQDLAMNLKTRGFTSAIVNTTVSGVFLHTLSAGGIRCVSLIHELAGVIRDNSLQKHAMKIAEHADCIVFPAKEVLASFEQFATIDKRKIAIRPQGLYKHNSFAKQKDEARQIIKKRHSIPENASIIIGVGFADRRKGIDLFVNICEEIIKANPATHFIWIGHWHIEMEQLISSIVAADPDLQAHLHFTGLTEKTDVYYAGADALALTSREDPFPSVVLEAMEVGLPVVAFDGAGGFCSLLREGCGSLVSFENTYEFARALLDLITNQDKTTSISQYAKERVEREFSFHHYIFDLLGYAGHSLPKVSTIVPNFNYAKYLPERISSILKQHSPIYELIILDDASTDESLEIINHCIEGISIPITVVVNKKNSGSVFRQWIKGVNLAKGDFAWIAEADDVADPSFLSNVLDGFKNADVVLSYCQSRQIASDGTILCNHYLEYVSDICEERWRKPYVAQGIEEIRTALCVKNTIPNVSAAVFDHKILKKTLNDYGDLIASYRVAGDWVTYLKVLENGSIAYCPQSLNSHRRHQNSVTIGGFNIQQLREIISIQQKTIEQHNVSHNMKTKSRIYAQSLYDQFGLSNSNHPNFYQHPELLANIQN
ncbi:MAG: glycoside hydrolase family 99-like domain-containing protein [Spongiibacteraceae bacterium]